MLNEGAVLIPELPVQKPSLIDSFKSAVQPETIAHKLGIDKNTLIDIGIYGAIGFIIGFLLKKYSEYFIAFVIFIVGIVALQQLGYISVICNSVKIQEALGLPSALLINDGYSSLLLQWLKSNVPAAASLIIGFLIGLKVA